MSDCLADIDVAVLCGGKGTRLAPIIGDLPKVLAPIKGRPFIEWHVEYLRSHGAKRIMLLGGHGYEHLIGLADQLGIELYLDDRKDGPASALYQVRDYFRSWHILITNGDTLLKGPICDFVYHMLAHYPSVLTVGGCSTGLILTSPGLIKEKYFVALPMEAIANFSFLDIGTPEGYARAEEFVSL